MFAQSDVMQINQSLSDVDANVDISLSVETFIKPVLWY